MSGSRLVKPAPTTDAELIRAFDQRIRQLETKQTLRVGDWVVHSTEDGRLLATKPGDVLDVGNPVADVVDLGALRGFVTDSEVAQAVSGGATNSLSTATSVQVAKDVATQNAQYTAETAQTTAARLDAQINSGASGISISDTFNRDAANDLGADYFRTVSAGADGEFGTDGTGNAASRVVTGAVSKTWTDRHVTELATDKQRTSAVLATPPRVAGFSGAVDSAATLIARCSTDNATRTEAYITGGYVEIGFRIAGAYTRIGDGVGGVGMADGDSWDFWAGTDGDDYEFVLLRNNFDVCVRQDVGHNSVMGASNRHGAISARAGTTVYAFFVTTQIEAPTFQSVNFADRT